MKSLHLILLRMFPLPLTPAALGCLGYFEFWSLSFYVFITLPVMGLDAYMITAELTWQKCLTKKYMTKQHRSRIVVWIYVRYIQINKHHVLQNAISRNKAMNIRKKPFTISRLLVYFLLYFTVCNSLVFCEVTEIWK